MVLNFDFSFRCVTLVAINCVSENVSFEPFSVIKCNIEGEFFPIVFTNINVSQFFNLFFVKLFCWSNLSFITFQNIESEIVWL